MFQGTGLEFLIFCGFCTTLLLLACVISMCNRPRELMIVPPVQSPAAIEARIENPQDIVSTNINKFHKGLFMYDVTLLVERGYIRVSFLKRGPYKFR